MKLAIFDLDGVLVDTAKYHYLAWKSLADELGFVFTEEHNQRLKGVSRMASLEFLLETGGLQGVFTDEEKSEMATRKNARYQKYIKDMPKDELFDGVVDFFNLLKSDKILIALGTASRNSDIIIDNLELRKYFDCIADGNVVSRAKPDPEVFLYSAEQLGIDPKDCVVFEDAEAGIAAAKAGGMTAIGVNNADLKSVSDYYIDGIANVKTIYQKLKDL